ncbi:MAG: antitoxin VapB family protein [Methanoregula sp.]|nr:antitoxin VapB family protein [Methanoregula sp.]
METRTINIRKSAYHALKAQKRTGESFSDLILRVAGGEEKSVCDFLQTIDPAVRREIAKSVKKAKVEFDRVKPRKIYLKP